MKNIKLVSSIAVVSGVMLCMSLVAYAQVDSSTPTMPPQNSSSTPGYITPCPPPGASSTAIYNCPMIPYGYGQNGSSTNPFSRVPSSTRPMSPGQGEGMGGGNQPSLSISGQGNVKLTDGQVQTVNGASLTVSVFGIDLNVNTANAQFGGMNSIPGDIMSILNPSSTTMQASTSTTINVGDMVNVTGSIASSTGVINATNVEDLSTQSQMSNTIQNRINQLMQLIDQLRSQL